MYTTDVTDAQWDNIKNYLIGKARKRKFVCVQYGMR